jgi:V8-like Glu-specific endopeptidase
MTDSVPTKGVDLLRFAGDRGAPTPLEKVYGRDPVLARGEPPGELLRMRDERRFYVPRDPETGKSPEAAVERVGAEEQPGLWQVSLPVSPTQPTLALPGQSLVRESPEAIAAAIDPKVGTESYRPEWMPMFPTPRPAPGSRHQLMRRLNGRASRPLYVFPPDERAVFRDAAWPWGAVGRVFNSDGASGTGALVGPNLMVTCGHIVPWASSSWWIKFVPAYYDGSSLHGAGVESYVADVRGFNSSGDVTGYDFAICRLSTPLGTSLGYFGYNTYDESWNNQALWTMVGYPGAIASAERPSWQANLSIFDVDSDSNGGSELESRADATPGNSGGPLYGWWSGQPKIIGVVSGEETDWVFPLSSEMGTVCAGGSGFTNLIAWGRTNWP